MHDVPEPDTTRVKLNSDQEVVMKRISRELKGAVASIDQLLNSADGLDALTARSIVSVAESKFAELGKILGVETESAAAIERRHADIRHANIRIHELESQLGNSQTPRLVQLALKSLEDQLTGWWRQQGFGLVSKVTFGAYNCRVEFSCRLWGDYEVVESATPVSDREHKKAWLESWRQQGLVTAQDHDLEIKDCDASRDFVRNLIRSNIPSADVISFINHRLTRRGVENEYGLRSIEVLIRRIEDIQDLPYTPEKFD